VAYRKTVVHTMIGDDSNLSQVDYDRTAILDQSQDQQVFHTSKTVNPADAEALLPIAPVVSGYYVEIRSDYPIMVRLNGVSATQYTMKSNNVQPVNVGAPTPDRCIFVATVACTSIYLAPIAGATQAAKVKVACVGDPISAYV
jgi:hypothetical protein